MNDLREVSRNKSVCYVFYSRVRSAPTRDDARTSARAYPAATRAILSPFCSLVRLCRY